VVTISLPMTFETFRSLVPYTTGGLRFPAGTVRHLTFASRTTAANMVRS